MKAIYKFALKDIRILEVPAIQTVIQFKWDAYTKRYYQACLFLIMTSLTLFSIELNHSNVVPNETATNARNIVIGCKIGQIFNTSIMVMN